MTEFKETEFKQAERWLWSAFRIEEMPNNHPVHATLQALRIADKVMQEPSDGMNLCGSGMSDKTDKSCEYFKAGQFVASMTFQAMRDKMIKELGENV